MPGGPAASPALGAGFAALERGEWGDARRPAPLRLAHGRGTVPAEIHVTLTGEDGGTALTYAATAEAGLKGVFGKLTEPLVTRIFERDTSADLAKLKALVEARS